MFKSKDNSEETVMYLESDLNLDETLKSYEHTVEISEENKANKKKIIILVSSIIAILCAICICLIIFLGKNIPSTVVKSSDNTFSICNKNSFKIPQEIVEYRIDYSKNIFAFSNNNGNLFYLDLKKCDNNNDIKLIAEKIENNFSIFKEDEIIYKSNGTLFSYNISKKSKRKIAEKTDGYFLCENGSYIYYLTNDKKLFVTNLSETKELLSNIDEIKCFKNSQKLNLIITQNSKLFFADENGLLTLLSENFLRYFCANENETFENIYFLEKSNNKKITSVTFEDELKKTDSTMVKPSSTDYQKSFAFGLIKFIDPAQYKKAYMNYQEKLGRDRIRNFVENFKNSGEFYNLFCFDRKEISLIKENIKSDEILSFSSNKDALVFYRNIFSDNLTLEISDLQKEIKNLTTQEEFNKIIIDKLKEKNNSNYEIIGKNLNAKASVDKKYNEMIFSSICNCFILKNNNCFSVIKIIDSKTESIFLNEKYSSLIFDNDKIFYVDNKTLFSIDLSTCEKIEISNKISNLIMENGNIIATEKITEISNNYYLLEKNQKNLLCKNASDIIYVNKNHYSYISDGKLVTKIDSKVFTNENVVSIIK